MNVLQCFKKLIFSAMVLLVASCAENPKSELEFFNDLENIRGWGGSDNNVHTVVKASAKSGNYVSKTDTANRFGYIFKIKLADVSQQQLKTVKTAVWVSTPVIDDKPVLVISVDSVGKNIYWSGQKLIDYVKTPNQWTEVLSSYDLSALKPSDDYTVGVYIWNTGNSPILADDYRVKFFE